MPATKTLAKEVLSFRITRGTHSAQAAFWVDGDTPTVFTRPGEASSTNKLRRWTKLNLDSGEFDNAAIYGSMIESALKSLLIGNESDEVKLEGFWSTEITAVDRKQLGDDGTAMPNSLQTRVSKTFETSPPKSFPFVNVTAVAEMVVRDPMTAQFRGKDLTEWTVSTLGAMGKGRTVGGLITQDELDNGIPIYGGKVYKPRPSNFPGLGEMTDVEYYRRMQRLGKPVGMFGPPGTGKTAGAWAAFGHNLVVMDGGPELEIYHMVGSFVPSPVQGELAVWVDGPLLVAMKNGWPFLLDEAMRTRADVMTILYPLMDGRGTIFVKENPAMGTVVALPGFYVAVASNPDVPGAYLDEPLASRLGALPTVLTDFRLAADLGVPRAIITIAQILEKKRQSKDIQWSPQLRELLNFKDATEEFGAEYAIAELVSRAQMVGTPTDVAELMDALRTTLGKTEINGLVVK